MLRYSINKPSSITDAKAEGIVSDIFMCWVHVVYYIPLMQVSGTYATNGKFYFISLVKGKT